MIITYTDSARHGKCEECGKSFIRRAIDAADDGKLCRDCYLEQKRNTRAAMTSMTGNRTTELVSRREATTLLEEFLCGYQNILLSRGINASEAVCKQNELIDEYAERIEQAIAATLGGGKLTAEQVRDAVMSADRWEKPMGNTGLTNTHLIIRDDGWQAIADELNAELGSGTCEWLLEHSGTLYDKWRCSKCGYLHVESRTDGSATDLDPNFCPNCGKAVER